MVTRSLTGPAAARTLSWLACVLWHHYPMLQRNLLYTGVTRGRRLVVLVGQRRDVGIAVRGAQALRRWSNLKAWLEALSPRAGATA